MKIHNTKYQFLDKLRPEEFTALEADANSVTRAAFRISAQRTWLEEEDQRLNF